MNCQPGLKLETYMVTGMNRTLRPDGPGLRSDHRHDAHDGDTLLGVGLRVLLEHQVDFCLVLAVRGSLELA